MHFEQVFWALVHGHVCTLHRCIFTPTYTSANTLAAGCAHMCICTYVCICMHIHMSVYMCAYTFIYARVCVYICTRVGAFCLFVLSNLSTTCACITGVFQHLHACVWGDWKWGLFQVVMVSAVYWRGRLCFGRGRDRGFVLYISLFLRVFGWWVCVCLYTRVYTHKLLGYLM